MRKNNKKPLVLTILTTCMLILTACGKSEEIVADETSSILKSEAQETVIQENALQETTETMKTDIDDTTEIENNESISTEKGVPWDKMSPVNIKNFPAGITGSVDENNVFFPDILFPSECTIADGICRANLDNKDYNAYAYVETHARTITDGGELYFEQAKDFIIHTKDSVHNIEIKDTIHNYSIKISVEIWGADDAFMDEYLLKNCEYIKEQIEEMTDNESITAEEDTSGTETADNKSVQGETPYGAYECESGAEADVGRWHNEIDIIDIFLNDDEFMTNFEWVEGKTYNLIMPNDTSPLAVATFDENGNMQITALSDEAKPYEGYYILKS